MIYINWTYKGAQGGSWTHKTSSLRAGCFPITSPEHTWPPGVNTNTSPLEQYPTRRYAGQSYPSRTDPPSFQNLHATETLMTVYTTLTLVGPERLERSISWTQTRRNSHYPTDRLVEPGEIESQTELPRTCVQSKHNIHVVTDPEKIERKESVVALLVEPSEKLWVTVPWLWILTDEAFFSLLIVVFHPHPSPQIV